MGDLREKGVRHQIGQPPPVNPFSVENHSGLYAQGRKDADACVILVGICGEIYPQIELAENGESVDELRETSQSGCIKGDRDMPPFLSEAQGRKRSFRANPQAVQICPCLGYCVDNLRNILDAYYSGDYGCAAQAVNERFIKRAYEKMGTQR